VATPVLTPQQNLQAAYAASCAALAQLYILPRPDESVDGASYQWSALRKSLLEEQEMLLEAILNADGPFEVVTYPPGA
jgi:hypothetical protein